MGTLKNAPSAPRQWAGRRAIGETTVINAGIASLGVVTGVLTARLLGPAGRGALALGISISAMITAVIGVGLPQAFAYLLAARHGEAAEAVSLSIWSGAVLGALGVAVGWLLVPAFIGQEDASAAVRIGLFAVPVSLIGGSLTGVLQGLRLGRRFNATRWLAPAMYCAGVLLLVVISDQVTVTAVMVAYVGAVALSTLASYALVDARYRRLRFPSRRFVASSARYGLVVSASGIALAVNQQIALPVLAALEDLQDVGFYAIGLSYATPVGLVAVAVALHVLPDVAAARPSERGHVIRRQVRNTALSLAVLGPLAVIAAPLLVPFAFGDSFRPAVPVAQLLAIALAVHSLSHVLAEAGRGLGRPGLYAVAEGSGVIGTIGLLPLVVPSFGVKGAAVVAVVVNTTVLVLLALGVRRAVAQEESANSRDREPSTGT
jgi:O-antigen/teichoic acid export membrane protein